MTISFPANRTAWFPQARYGMFIHWGLYSILGREAWAMNRERIAPEDYEPLADQFSVVNYRPAEWAALAKEAGMKYMVLTTKHHDGFCLWDSKACRYNAVNSAAKRDLLAEYVDAVRAAGLKVGLYYSLGDWHHPDWAKGWRGDADARRRFMDYTHTLVEELMTGYGPIDLLFYDLPQCYSAEEWRSVELNAKVRALQPGIMINNRAMTTEDYATPEQHLTASREGRLWESCMTLNDHWGYRPADKNWKTPTQLARNLASVAAGGGNFLLNVGPDGTGKIPSECVEILLQTGQWLRDNHEAIFTDERSQLPWTSYGTATVKGNSLYLFLQPYEGAATTLGGLTAQVQRVTWLNSGEEVAFEQKGPQTRFVGLPDVPPTPSILPVIKIELDGPPALDISEIIGGADMSPQMPV